MIRGVVFEHRCDPLLGDGPAVPRGTAMVVYRWRCEICGQRWRIKRTFGVELPGPAEAHKIGRPSRRWRRRSRHAQGRGVTGADQG